MKPRLNPRWQWPHWRVAYLTLVVTGVLGKIETTYTGCAGNGRVYRHLRSVTPSLQRPPWMSQCWNVWKMYTPVNQENELLIWTRELDGRYEIGG